MASVGQRQLSSKADGLQLLITASEKLVPVPEGFANRACGKCAGFEALQTKVDDLQRDNARLIAKAQAAEQQVSTQPTNYDVCFFS
jgi:hypothetical protein